MRYEQESRTYAESLDPPRRAAVEELMALVAEHYPSASFAIGPGQDEPEATHIVATVDLDDPDEVVDLVIDRMLTLQIDEGLPIHLIPIRTPERTEALLRRQRQREGSEALLPSAQL